MPESSFSADAVVIGRGITHRFRSTKTDAADSSIVDGPKWSATHFGSSEWDYVIRKSGDQLVTNSAVLTDDTELKFNTFDGQTWRYELVIIYSSDTSGDYKFAIAAPFSVGWHRYIGSDGTTNAIVVSTGIRTASGSTTATATAGGSGSGFTKMLFIEGMITTGGNGVFKYQFAQNSQTGGQSANTRTGSLLKAARIF